MISYAFGDFRLVPSDQQLLQAGKPVPLPPKVFETLVLLVSSHGRLVEKEDFLKRVWLNAFVEEVALAHAISQLRKVLRTGGTGDSNFIETVPKRGYRFIAPVESIAASWPAAAPRITIAVLPFDNLGAGEEREYLADGLTEEVIGALGQVNPERISVIGRTSMMTYKRAAKPLAKIAGELGADFLVESSIRGEGGRLRITSRLIRGLDQIQVWSESYDSEPASMIELQRELSTAIASQVHLRLSPDRLNALRLRHSERLEAYDLYLRGRYFWHQLSPQTTRRAVEYYTRATQLDPAYALAWSGIADAYATSPINGDGPPLNVWPLCREAVEHALAADPNLAEVQTSLGLLKFWLDWDWPAAIAALQRATELDPSYSLAHRTLGIVLSHSGRHQEALAAARRARELDPLHAGHQALSAQVSFNARDYQAAVKFARQATLLDPEFWVGHIQLAQAYEQAGEPDWAPNLALDALQNAWRFSGGNSKALALRGYILARLGRHDEAREVLASLASGSASGGERYIPLYASALVYAGLGERRSALDALQRAYEAHDVHLAFLPVDPKWDEFRQDAAFQEIQRRCSF